MTVEELIEKLQQVKDKKSQVKMDTPSSGSLLYKGIRDVQSINDIQSILNTCFRA